MKKNLLNKKIFILIFIFFTTFLLGSFLDRTGIFSITVKVNDFINNSGLSKIKNMIRYNLLNEKKVENEKKLISSNYYNFELIKIERPSYDKYGGIDFFNKNLLYVDKKGVIWIKQINHFLKLVMN